jgi:site-specific DNA-methyltransferase (adenine-specific)
MAKLINEITWVKTNPVPKQCPKKLISATEPFFVFAKTKDYYFNKSAFLKREKQPAKKAGENAGSKYADMIENSDLSGDEKARARKELAEAIAEVRQGKLHGFRMKIRGMHSLPYGGQAGGRLTQIKNKGFTIIKMRGDSVRRDVIESRVETIKGNIHPAAYPEFVILEMLKLLTKENDLVLDPFMGSGTTAVAARRLKRNYIGIEINPAYAEYAEKRASQAGKN